MNVILHSFWIQLHTKIGNEKREKRREKREERREKREERREKSRHLCLFDNINTG